MLFDRTLRKISEKHKSHLGQFSDMFNTQQKETILYVLMIIATSDSDIDPSETNYFNEVSKVLNFPMSEKLMQNVLNVRKDKVIATLNTLTRTQLDWFIVTMYGMAIADGVIDDKEVMLVTTILDDLGVPDDYTTKLLDKSFTFMNKLGYK